MKVKEIKTLLARHAARPSKGLGQHFLIDRSVLGQILTAAELGPEDTVLEIGPGLGVLTCALAEHAGRVVAVELDQKLVSLLHERLAGFDNVEVVRGDILELDPAALVGPLPLSPAPRYKVVANLPYYITSAVLRHLLEASHKPHLIVVMVQLEVAQRILARPGDMSLLAVSVQFYGRPELVTRVPASAFWPPPQVDSAVLKVEVYDQPPVPVDDVTWFFRVARAGFGQRRKQLKNALAAGLHREREDVAAVLETAGVDPRRRAQTLSLEEWGAVAEALKVKRSNV